MTGRIKGCSEGFRKLELKEGTKVLSSIVSFSAGIVIAAISGVFFFYLAPHDYRRQDKKGTVAGIVLGISILFIGILMLVTGLRQMLTPHIPPGLDHMNQNLEAR